MSTPLRCPSCRTPGQISKLCAGCRNVHYCSTECQQADWPVHKLLCRTWRDGPARPATRNMHRILYLPVDHESPEFLWKEIDNIVHGGVAPIDIEEMIGTKSVLSLTTTQNLLLRHRLPYAMTVFFKTIMDDEVEALNKAAGTLVAGRSTFRWRGPMVAMIGSKKSLPDGKTAIDQVGDMDLNHCADLVAFLLDNQNQDPRHYARTRMGREWTKVQACKLACRGMIATGGMTAEVVGIPPAHYMFESETNISGISRRVGMPLHMAKYSSSRPFEGDDLVNVSASHMQNVVDVERSFKDITREVPRFGEPPKEWLSKVGNVLVARQDREPLDRDHLEAFRDFCAHQFDAWYQWGYVVTNCRLDAGQVVDEEAVKQLVLDQVTPCKWQEYLFAWTSVASLAERILREPTGKGKAELQEMISDFGDYALDAGGARRMLKRMLRSSFEVMVGGSS